MVFSSEFALCNGEAFATALVCGDRSDKNKRKSPGIDKNYSFLDIGSLKLSRTLLPQGNNETNTDS